MPQNDEFNVIDCLFKPLAGLTPEARGLNDDVAVLPYRDDVDLVVTTDALVEGVHFFKDDPLDQVAQKLLRVNLSDLAAKGAVAYGYQLLTIWPKDFSFEQKQKFCEGLRRDQIAFGLELFGGDTVSTNGPLSISVTAFGHIPKGHRLSRIGACEGDRVLVSGEIGQSYLGLQVLKGRFETLNETDKAELIESYRLPNPRFDLAVHVLNHATASMDISDGLIADAEKLGIASGVCVCIDINKVPGSKIARALLRISYDEARSSQASLNLLDLMSGGDDYEILCCARGAGAEALLKAGFYDIGYIKKAPLGVEIMSDNRRVEFTKKGWVHA